MTDNSHTAVMAALEEATGGLSKLPILGPALWLYAKDAEKRFMFVGDIEWAVVPPVVLDQCRLYMKNALPCAFFTWALVNAHVASRLRAEHPRLAPHEWKCGKEIWIIDAVAPFGQLEEGLTELRETVFAGSKVSALIPDPDRAGALLVRDWPPAAVPTKH